VKVDSVVVLSASAPSLAEGDRVLLQGLIAVTLTLTLAVLLQSRILDAKEEAPMPEWIRRFVPIIDVFLTPIMTGIGAGVIVVALWALSNDEPLTADDRTYVAWIGRLVALLALWVFAVAVWRRILPGLWRRRPDQPWRLQRDRLVETMVLFWSPLGVFAGVSLLARDATGWLPLLAMAITAVVEQRWATWSIRRGETKRITGLKTQDLSLHEARLAGFAERDTPQVQVLRARESPDVWLTLTQAKDLAAAFEWAKQNVDALDDRDMRSRSVEFKNKWYRGWWPPHRKARQVFTLSITDGRGPPTKLESDATQVLRVHPATGLFVPEPAVVADAEAQRHPSPPAVRALGDPARGLTILSGIALIVLAGWSDRRRRPLDS
jgi:hypothetical protein